MTLGRALTEHLSRAEKLEQLCREILDRIDSDSHLHWSVDELGDAYGDYWRRRLDEATDLKKT